ncbi:MAG TPA: endonuclease III [Thermomicrobiales bacterium]|nr:endonuclease III [Thermomicrobiales bacterium]
MARVRRQINGPDASVVVDALRSSYGPPVRRAPRPAIDELIMTILSQHTSDINTERAYTSLRARFPRWEDVADAAVEDIADAIRSGGLANVKAVTIHSVLSTILERTGGLDLDALALMQTHDALAWLTSLRGVGPKTAACVLLFSMDRPAMPVDTHVHRVSLRLRLVPPGTSAELAPALLEACIPPDSMYDAHMLLIQHGRVTCKARAPRCGTCVLASRCPSAGIS